MLVYIVFTSVTGYTSVIVENTFFTFFYFFYKKVIKSYEKLKKVEKKKSKNLTFFTFLQKSKKSTKKVKKSIKKYKKVFSTITDVEGVRYKNSSTVSTYDTERLDKNNTSGQFMKNLDSLLKQFDDLVHHKKSPRQGCPKNIHITSYLSLVVIEAH
jgi:hypothetical protein